jgi:predicted transcriptional regulator
MFLNLISLKKMMFKDKRLDKFKSVLKDTFSKIRQDIDSNNVKIIELMNENRKLKKTLQDIQASNTNKKISGKINEIDKKILNLKDSITLLNKKDDDVKKRIDSLNSRFNKLRRSLSNLSNNSIFEKTVKLEEFNKLIEMNETLYEYLVNLEVKLTDLIEAKLGNIGDIRQLINERIKEEISSQSIKSTITTTSEAKFKSQLIKKIDRNKKSIIKQKIVDIVKSKQVTLPELKEIVVDEHCYCSKASFYRYFEELKTKDIIDFVDINNLKVIVLNENVSDR